MAASTDITAGYGVAKKPLVTHKSVRDSSKLNVWCGLMQNCIFGSFVFAEKIINCTIFLDTLELFLFPQLDELPNTGNIYLQMDGAPSHYTYLVRIALDEKFPNTWIG